jgi:ABC-2 type transport system ATP-binding protein
MTPAIEVEAVHKRFATVQALAGVDLRIEPGEFFGLLGPNGAGKTTLISILAGLTRADSGTLKVMGHDVRREYALARRALGVVPQELVFDPFFTVRETLLIQSGYFGLRDNGTWVDEIIARLDLEDKAHANMRQLSGGMKRRVLVAQALVHKPPVIILDEPTAGVDVELRQGLWRFVRELNQAGHTTRHFLCGVAGMRLRLRLAPDRLPEALSGMLVAADAGSRVLALERFAQIEEVLAVLREARIEVQELEVVEADLEDVFVQMMHRH